MLNEIIEKKSIMSRLVLDISNEQHQQIKAMAALSGIRLKEFVIQKIFSRADDERAYEDLKSLLLSRIEEASSSEPPSLSSREIAREE